MTIKQIFDEIAAEPGSNMKMEILRKYKDNPTLKKVLYLAKSKRVKFYIKQIPTYNLTEIWGGYKLENALDDLNELSSRRRTGHDASNFLGLVLANLSADDSYIIERIIEKDPKIGMGGTNINKVIPDLIEKTPYMGAKSFKPELVRKMLSKGPAYSEIKMDGRYANAIIRANEVELESRVGEENLFHGAKFVAELCDFTDCVLNGELTMDGYHRYISNGIISSIVTIGKKRAEGEDVSDEIMKFEKENGIGFQEALNKIRYTVWDMITVEEYFNMKSNVEYCDRKASIEILLHRYTSTMISAIQYREVTTYEEAVEHFNEVLGKGEEGTILKSCKGIWKDGKDANIAIKFKLEMTVDLKITGFNYGTGKNKNFISSLNATSEDGLVFTKPTGIDEKMMKYITDNQELLMGKIVECKSCGLSQDSAGNYALLHPVFKEIRDDKHIADSLVSIKQIEAMAKGLA